MTLKYMIARSGTRRLNVVCSSHIGLNPFLGTVFEFHSQQSLGIKVLYGGMIDLIIE